MPNDESDVLLTYYIKDILVRLFANSPDYPRKIEGSIIWDSLRIFGDGKWKFCDLTGPDIF